MVMSNRLTYEELEQKIKDLEQIVSDSKIEEARLKESEITYRNISRMLRLMCDNMPTMIWAKDLQKRYIFVNKAVCSDLLSAVDTDEPIGKTDIFFAQRERSRYPDNPKWHTFGEICRDTDQITMDAGKPMQFDEYGNVQGKFMFLDVHKAPFIDENGVMIGTVGSAQNITEYKEAESQIRQLQKNESLGYMAAGIAHLFNNYLYIVSGNLELALESIPEDSVLRYNIVEAINGTYRCADVSGAMLTYLGHNFTKSQPIDISEFCKTSLSNFRDSMYSDIAIETNLTDDELIVNANAGQMKEVLTNLINNAYESIGQNKGVICLNTKIISASDILKLHILPVDSKPLLDRYACLEVTDTGCGIPKKDIYEIADPFFTTKFTGRGLGLAVVLGIVRSWGGMIGVNSEIGIGSSFMVFLPLYIENPQSK